jgi:hypothetical protein
VHVLQGRGHAQTRWMQGPPLIVVEDAASRRTIIAPHILRRLVRLDRLGRGRLAWGLGKRGRLRRPPCGSDLPCDRSHPPDGPPPLPLGAAVGFQDRLGHLP